MKRFNTPTVLFFLIALTRAFGLLRSLTLARVFGSGMEAAAFELSQSVSAFLYDTVISTVIAAMFIPAYVKRKESDEKDRFISTLLYPILLIGTVLYLPLVLFPKAVLSLTAGDISEALIQKAAPSLSLLSLGRITLSASSLFVGVLQSEKRAALAALYYCLSSLVSFVFSALTARFLTALSLSALLSILDIALLLTLSASVRHRHSVSISQARRFSVTRHMLFRAFWVILSGVFLPLLTLLSSLSSAHVAGSVGVSLIGYAARLVLLGAALLTSVTHASYYAVMAKASDPLAAMKKILLRLFLLSLLATAALILFADPVIQLLYQRSALTEAELKTLAQLLTAYAPSIIALTLSSLLSDYAYLRNRTTHIAIGNLLAIAVAAAVVYFVGMPSLPYIPLYFTLAAFLRLVFTALTVFSKKEREKPRVLLVLSDKNIGGAGRWLLTYLKNADSAAFDLHVALPDHALLQKEIEALGYPVHPMGTERSFSLKNTILAIKLMLFLKPDLINTSASLSAKIAAFITRVPVRVYTRHCVYPPKPLYRFPPIRLLSRLFSRLLSQRAIAVAPEARDNLVAMGLLSRLVEVIPNGTLPLSRDISGAIEIRKRYGIQDAPCAILCARLEKDKSVITLVEAIAHLKRNERPFHALILGCGSEEAALKAAAKAADVTDRVHFCGFVKNVAPYLSAADVYVNCSIGSEATSLAIAEAMSLSLPIVATDYGGNPHMVKEGYNGILVSKQDPRELADALLILSDEVLNQKFGEASFEHYTLHYRADRMARQYEAFYKTLLRQKGYRII